jgi:hypothetical protein
MQANLATSPADILKRIRELEFRNKKLELNNDALMFATEKLQRSISALMALVNQNPDYAQFIEEYLDGDAPN